MPNNLEKILIQKISEGGVLDLGEFIELALTHPEYGYYMYRDPFGEAGDFTTAPEISQMFGEVIGAWVANIWMQMGRPTSFNLIEVGAGRGTLMADIMRSCKSVSGFADAAQIHFIEASKSLCEKQSDALRPHNASWHNNIVDINVDRPCIILGNEFIDALPVEQLKRGEKGWQKRVVIAENDNLSFDWQEADKDLIELLPQKTESNQLYEVSPSRKTFISECSNLLKKSGGVALFIDYGYVKSHYGDTLQAIKNHEFTEVLEDIGECDITTHVDFDALSRQVKSLGLTVEPIITQREFLSSIGIEIRASALKKISDNKADIAKDLERLIGRKHMGDLFKVMCFYK